MVANHRPVRAASNPAPLASHLTAATESEEERDRAALAMGETRGPGEHKGAVPYPRRDMSPDMAVAIGIDPGRPLTLEEFENVIGGRRADGGEQPRRRQADHQRKGAGRTVQPIDGYDVVVAAGGSFVAARELAATDGGAALLDLCFDQAANGGMRFLEREAAFARRGAGGAREEPGEFGWIYEDHVTAKAVKGEPLGADPRRHRHYYVPNIVRTESGHFGAINAARMRGVLMTHGAYTQALLATRLREVGVKVSLDHKTGEARIDAIPRALVDAFSKRTQAGIADAKAYAASKEKEWGKTWDQLSEKSRNRLINAGMLKTQAANRDGMANRWGWRAQAAALGFPPRDVVNPAKPTTRDFTDASRASRAWAVLQPMVREALFKEPVLRAEAVRAMAARALVVTGTKEHDDIDRVTDMLRTHGVRLEKGEGRVPLVWMRDPLRGRSIMVTTMEHARRENRQFVEVPVPGSPKEREPLAALLRRAEAIRVGTVRLAVETKVQTQGKDVRNLSLRLAVARLRNTVRAIAPPPTERGRQTLAHRAAQTRYALAVLSYGTKRVVARATYTATRRSFSLRVSVGAAVLAYKTARLAVRVPVAVARAQATRTLLRSAARDFASLAKAPGALRAAFLRAKAARAAAASKPVPTPAERAAGLRDNLLKTMEDVRKMEARPGVLKQKIELSRAAPRRDRDTVVPAMTTTERPNRPAAAPRITRRVEVGEADAAAQLSAALRSNGFKLRGHVIQFDDRWHALPLEGDKAGERSGSYRAKGDAIGYTARLAKKGVYIGGWSAKGDMKPVSPEEAEKIRIKLEAEKAARERAERRKQEQAGASARKQYADAKPATDQHPYLLKKGLAPTDRVKVDGENRLVIPFQDFQGRHVNNQTIWPDGKKRPVSGAQKTGTYSVVGKWVPGQPAIVAEGWATARRVNAETGLAVVMAWDTSNLMAVAKGIREGNAAIPIVFAADNDHHLPKRDIPMANAGIKYAEEAAKAVGNARVWAPPEVKEHAARGVGTDWDDYAQARGKGAVRAEWRRFRQESGAPWAQRAQQGREAMADRAPAQQSQARRMTAAL